MFSKVTREDRFIINTSTDAFDKLEIDRDQNLGFYELKELKNNNFSR